MQVAESNFGLVGAVGDRKLNLLSQVLSCQRRSTSALLPIVVKWCHMMFGSLVILVVFECSLQVGGPCFAYHNWSEMGYESSGKNSPFPTSDQPGPHASPLVVHMDRSRDQLPPHCTVTACPVRTVLGTAMLRRQWMTFGRNHLEPASYAPIHARIRRPRSWRVDLVKYVRITMLE
jgi:hypothetical protein